MLSYPPQKTGPQSHLSLKKFHFQYSCHVGPANQKIMHPCLIKRKGKVTMKKSIISFLVGILTFMIISPVQATRFNIKPLPSIAGPAYNPRINSRGQVVWQYWDAGANCNKVCFYSNGVSQSISMGEKPHINNLGHFVWVIKGGSATDIILKKDGITSRIISISSLGEPYPQIDDQGRVYYLDNNNLMRYDNESITQLMEWVSYFKINSKGKIVITDYWNWYGIIIYDGSNFNYIYNNISGGYNDLSINDNGEVIWSEYTNTNSKIMLYSSGNIIPISDNKHSQDYYYNMRLNNQGQAVWDSAQVMFYANGSTIPIRQGSSPDMNDRGQVVFSNGVIYLSTPTITAPWMMLLSRLLSPGILPGSTIPASEILPWDFVPHRTTEVPLISTFAISPQG